MRVADYVADFIANLGIRHVFGVVGGGAMYLNDAFGNHDKLQFIPNHHEQASAMAADAYARMNGIGCCLVTTGPGGTNAITGVACAWIDSIPLIVISGQCTSNFLIGDTDLRQAGVQESDIVSLVQPITKYAVTVLKAQNIRYELERALFRARNKRGGPVWIDIPLDVQRQEIEPTRLHSFIPYESQPLQAFFTKETAFVLGAIAGAKRPVLIVGNGVRLAGAENELLEFVHALKIMTVTSWSAADMLADDEFHLGHCGLFGDRASNFAVQNADLLLVIGCRLSIPMIGHNAEAFAPNAKIIMIDVSMAEMTKSNLSFAKVGITIEADAKSFLRQILPLTDGTETSPAWRDRCRNWKERYPVVNLRSKYLFYTNSYLFIDRLCEVLPDDAVVVTDMGTAFTCTFQAATMKKGQRWFTASGHAPMGYGLPGAIGAHFATGKPVFCMVGDGGLQMNVHELSVIAKYRLPITIFVFDNGGYLTMRHTQENHFKRTTGIDFDSGLAFPDLSSLATAYNLPIFNYHSRLIENYVNGENHLPKIGVVNMHPSQALVPRVQTKRLDNGELMGGDLADMYPYLPRDEFAENMR